MNTAQDDWSAMVSRFDRSEQVVRGKVARGTLYLTAAQGLFLVCGYAIHLGLARILGPASYGIYGVVISLLVWIEMSVVNGIPTALEKFVAERAHLVSVITKQALAIQTVYSVLLCLLLVAGSQIIAGIMGDGQLGYYLRIAAIDIPVYAFFYVYIGTLNGMRSFGKQAVGVVVYSLSKAAVILLLVFLGLSLTGAFIGNIVASLFGLIAVFFLYRTASEREMPAEGGTFDRSALVKFAVPVVLLVFSRQFFQNLDLFCVKALLRDDVQTGFYTAAQALAKTPSHLFVGLVFTLFPSLAKSIARGNEKAAGSYIRQAVRFLLIVVAPMVCMVVPTSQRLVILLFSPAYAAAAPALSVLMVGWVFLTFLFMMTSAMVADNKPYHMILVSAVLIALDLVLIMSLIPRYGLRGAAWATTITAMVGGIGMAALVFRRFSVSMAPLTMLRVACGSVIVYGMAAVYQAPHIFLLLEYVLLLGGYVGILYITGEIRKDEIAPLVSGLFRKETT